MEFTYNSLNLLSLVKQDNQTVTQYTYDADGIKLSVRNGDGSSGYDYLGSLIYKKTTGGVELESAMFVDGSLKPTETNYFLCDHLGSVRSVVNGNGTIQEQNDFYPFGSEYADTNYANSNNRFLFSGKERQDLLDEGIYDFGARMYDAALGKWHIVDPLSEKYHRLTPYGYCYSNPLRYIDPNGQDGLDVFWGYIIGLITNILPGTDDLRDAYTPTDAEDYNNALEAIDDSSLVLGGMMVAGGGSMMAAGETATVTGAVVTVGSGGAVSAVSVPVAATGAAITEAGAVTAAAGIMMMSNAQNNKEAGYDRGKQSNVSSGNKNSPHANPKAKSVAEQKYLEAKERYEKLDSKPRKTHEEVKERDRLKNQMEHWKSKKDFSGENHSRNAKGNR